MKRIFDIGLWMEDSKKFLTPPEIVFYGKLYQLLDGQELDEHNHFKNKAFDNGNYCVLNCWVKEIKE